MAETTTSPVFSSPSYWVALGAGVVGIAAAAMQERTGSGSAAYRPFTSYGGDPYWMNAKYAGTDAKGLAFKKGERVFYYPKTKTIYAGANAETAYHDFRSMAEDEDFMGGGGSYNEGSAARGGNFGGMDEAEWHDDFFARYGRETLTRLNRIAHEAELHYRPKDDPGYWGGMGTYRSMYDRILSGAKRYGIDERAAKAYASARGFYPEPTSKRRY